tara:strand:- start:375 stop:1469 length:1095 start_codon:yes stop_codon:yes gene_type:complete
MLSPIAKINLKNIKSNCIYIKRKVNNSRIMAVVKADAYGHGIVEISKFLSHHKLAYGFCVALSSEIDELIKNKVLSPILHLGRIDLDSLSIYCKKNVYATINSLHDIEILSNFGKKNNVRIKAHIKVDTGMNRMGVRLNELDDLIDCINSKFLDIKGVYSHFSSADENDNSVETQVVGFNLAINKIKSKLGQIDDIHIANTSAILNRKDCNYNMVRVGLAIYGISSLRNYLVELKPAMELQAPLVLIKKIKKGESVGYNRKYISEGSIRIGLVQIGYADGLPPSFCNKGKVYFNGKSCKVIGKVSMDLISIDISNVNINVGDMITIWGGEILESKLEELSKKFNNIPYHYLTSLSKRVLKEYEQ